MPSQKKKRGTKPDTKPTQSIPVLVKSEPLDIKPLSAFVDERVKLIRQAFMCLKPKEVKALVPDFMSGKSIESIQEQCLDELLGISKKRLLSIINSTKCPTDTESSSDEDAQPQTEHISLDEISSDSEVEISQPAKNVKSKESKKRKNKEKESNVTETVEKNGNKKNEKEMTVLEILELQARARAIRSQLALEPVTKIELDSDQEHVSGTEAEMPKNSKSAQRIATMNTDARTIEQPPPTSEQPKRVRLKRNFRIRQVGDEDAPEQITPEPQKSNASDGRRKSKSASPEKEAEPKVVELGDSATEKENKLSKSKSRDSSPEVIPLIPSPETLLISSDSEEEKTNKKRLSIFVDNVEELDKERQKSKLNETQKQTSKPTENEEPEEGEISADEQPSISKQDSVENTISETARQNETGNNDDTIVTTSLGQMEEELDYEIKEVSDSEPESNAQGNDSSKTFEDADQSKSEVNTTKTSSADGKDCDSDNDTTSTSNSESESTHEEEDDPDIVEIHDSSDETLLDQKMAEDGPEKSWNSRWLESHKVAKVMAASRLGNKVRDKLKRNKKKEQEKNKAIENPPPEPERPPTVSNAVVGSVEHYNELISTSTDERAPTVTADELVDNK
ncbi:uncharacterized protein DDB_G0284459 [Wyeomyia smithii]|uniref:uncharacterized protein DDB_G0284459 n=1 Tax=Wyeomyia smithii TaxID=174621 RepID=UPI002467D001|nr:uncharacterized protein DDB_G0284459 [Wyeomyia smithii]